MSLSLSLPFQISLLTLSFSQLETELSLRLKNIGGYSWTFHTVFCLKKLQKSGLESPRISKILCILLRKFPARTLVSNPSSDPFVKSHRSPSSFTLCNIFGGISLPKTEQKDHFSCQFFKISNSQSNGCDGIT